MSKPSRVSNGTRVNLWLDETEYAFYKEECRQIGLPFVAWVRSLLRMQTGWRPPAVIIHPPAEPIVQPPVEPTRPTPEEAA